MKKYIIILTILTLLFSSCSNPFKHCMDGNSNLVTETRTTDDFTGIVSEGDFEVILIQDSVFSIEMEAEENLLPYITTDVFGSNLYIKTRDNRCIDQNYPIVVTVKAPEYKYISLSGSGTIDCNELYTNELETKLSGSGDIYLNVFTDYLNAKISGSGSIRLMGDCLESDMVISGSGDIKAYGFDQETCFSTISGSGDMFLNVSELLDGKITGTGTIYYIGNPAVNASITGSGSILNQN